MMSIKPKQMAEDLQKIPLEQAGELIDVAYACAKGHMRHEALSRYVARPVSKLEGNPFFIKSEKAIAELQDAQPGRQADKQPIPSDAKFYTKTSGSVYVPPQQFYGSYDAYLGTLGDEALEAVAEEMVRLHGSGESWAQPFVDKYSEYITK